MSIGDNINLDDALRRFDRLSGLDDHELSRLAQEVEVLQATPGSALLNLGSTDPRQLFLLEGRVQLIAGDGAEHVVGHTDQAALGPVSRLRPSRYQVNALTAVRYLMIDQRLLDRYLAHQPATAVVVEEALNVSGSSELVDDLANHPLMFDIFEDLNQRRVILPSDPEISIRVGRTLHVLSSDVSRLAQTLAVCPVLTLKILRAAMARAPQRSAIRSTKQAVLRLGVDETCDLAVQCVLRESLRTDSAVIRECMHSWWKRSMRVAAICNMLARMSERFDPQYASLIGLLHAIAEPVMLGYAGRHPDLEDRPSLDAVVHENRAQLGRILLMLWGMPREVIQAATLCNHWGYQHGGEADYTDILLVAEWHAMIGSRGRGRIPAISEIPAFARLGLDSESPELSLKIVEAGNAALDRADALLMP
jgi:HD-like signal output (HDOD) protein